MNEKTVEFLFDFASPTTYLAYTQLPAIANQAGAQIVYRPILLGGVFKGSNNSSPAFIPAKAKWMFQDLDLWAKRYNVAFAHNPNFPINTLTLMRAAAGIQLRLPDLFDAYLATVFKAMWIDRANMGDPAVVAQVLEPLFPDPDRFVALVSDPDVKNALMANTETAVARGVFGAPSFFVGDRLYFGQDRLDFVREALA